VLYLQYVTANSIRFRVSIRNVAGPGAERGRLGLGVTGLTNLAVGLESSSDLTHWGIIGVGVLADGTNSFSVPLATPGNQFYRLQVR